MLTSVPSSAHHPSGACGRNPGVANPVVAITGTSVIRSLTGFACLQVKEAMAHSWAAYEQFAWGFDELQPLTQEGKDSLGGLGATIVDSLDTLWMFDMQDEFGR